MLIFSEERSSLGSAWGMMGLAIKEVQLVSQLPLLVLHHPHDALVVILTYVTW